MTEHRETIELRLELGKCYRTRDGRKAGPMTGLGGFMYSFAGPITPASELAGTRGAWTAEGCFWYHKSSDPLDLVAPWEYPAPAHASSAASGSESITKASLLAEATATVAGRGKSYGRPEDNFQRIAELWSADQRTCTDGPEFTPLRVARFMALMKLARLQNDPTHHDSWVDIAGYAACGGEIAGAAPTDAHADASGDASGVDS